MKRLRKAMSIIAMAAMICVNMMLSSCAGKAAEAEPQALAVVIGAHGCSQGINYSNMKVTETVSDVILSNGFVSVVSLDGEPELIAANSYEIPEQYSHANKSKLREDAVKKSNALLSELTQIKADDPEVDTLEALRLALRSFADLPAGTEKTILIIDTGLSTTGILNFSNNILSAEPKAVVDQLMAQKAIPDFSGTTVIWFQMGDTAAPQQDLTDAQRANLQSIWQGVVEATGGTFVYSAAVSVEPTMEASELPMVSTIAIPGETPVSFDQVSLSSGDAFSEPVILSEDQVQFIGDSDKYIDEGKARKVIAPVADYMKTHEDLTLMLIGTTAGDSNDSYTMELSEKRAAAVMNTLVNMGVPAERIVCKGMGNSDPWHISGVGIDGELASQNRKVVLIDKAAFAAMGLV